MFAHRHCEDRAPPCKAQIESGSYVTMSRKKVVKKVEDLDDLGQFLLDKVCICSHVYRMYMYTPSCINAKTRGACGIRKFLGGLSP